MSKNIVVVAGRPGEGKTTYCLRDTTMKIKASNIGVIYISLEHSDEPLKYHLEQMKIDKIDNNIKLFRSINLSPSKVKDLILKGKDEFEKENKKLGVVYIDYLQLLDCDTYKGSMKNDSMEKNYNQLKIIAEELDIQMYIATQCKRYGDAINNGIPNFILLDKNNIELIRVWEIKPEKM